MKKSERARLRTCGASCCVCVVGGGEIWNGGLSHSGMRSWRSQSPSSAPWSFAGLGGRTGCRASTTVSHPPLGKIFLKTPENFQRCACVYCSHLSSTLLLAVEGTLLFALLACLWRPILLLRVGTTLALSSDESCNDVTVLARFGLKENKCTVKQTRLKCNGLKRCKKPDLRMYYRSKLFNILGTFLTDCVGFTAKENADKSKSDRICRLSHRFGNRCVISHLSCWNSDLQYVHFTIGCAIRHSCSDKERKCHLLTNYTTLIFVWLQCYKVIRGNYCNCKYKVQNFLFIIRHHAVL